jgi:RNA methyltransferase, rsmD family
VRERLFNWLGQDLSGLAVLDLFAGSGALGFEAASRNAQSVCLCEIHAQTAAALQRQAQEFGLQDRLRVVRQDALPFLQQSSLKFDVVFLDPPFGWEKWPELFKALENRLADQAAVYIEAEALPPLPPYLEVRREGRAGKSVFVLARQPEIGN